MLHEFGLKCNIFQVIFQVDSQGGNSEACFTGMARL